MELSKLSSNWKKLQPQLQKDKPTKSAKTVQHTNNTHGAINRKRRISTANATPQTKRVKMGSYLSREKDLSTTNGTTTEAPSAAHPPPLLADNDNDPTHALTIPIAAPVTPNLGFYPPAYSQKHKYIALDCEMVGLGPPPHSDSQLARVSLTNYHGALLYDSYVLPVLPVTDYRTFVSGILPEHLQPGVARSFRMVQDDVKSLLENRILVGHALKNDLSALMINHPKRDIRDTARLPAYREIAGGRAPALKKLAETFLGVQIQKGEHSSVVDARAAMALFRREKDAFERDAVKRFGVRREVLPEPAEVDEEREELRREKARIRNKKKKKRKK